MNIQQFINNPSLIDSLSSQQKVQLFQQLQSYKSQLESEKIKLETELTLKQKEQADLFQQLQTETSKTTLKEIKDYIDTLQTQFDEELKSIITQYQGLSQ